MLSVLLVVMVVVVVGVGVVVVVVVVVVLWGSGASSLRWGPELSITFSDLTRTGKGETESDNNSSFAWSICKQHMLDIMFLRGPLKLDTIVVARRGAPIPEGRRRRGSCRCCINTIL